MRRESIGTIIYVGDTVLIVSGLSDIRSSEFVYIHKPFSPITGQVFDIHLDGTCSVALFDGSQKDINIGDLVYRAFHTPAVRVGLGNVGTVITPSGSLVNSPDVDLHRYYVNSLFTMAKRRIEIPAPGIMERSPIRSTLFTGINAIDIFLPIGLGQRELIVGDKGTGKTTLAATIILHQRFLNLDINYRWRVVESHFLLSVVQISYLVFTVL